MISVRIDNDWSSQCSASLNIGRWISSMFDVNLLICAVSELARCWKHCSCSEEPKPRSRSFVFFLILLVHKHAHKPNYKGCWFKAMQAVRLLKAFKVMIWEWFLSKADRNEELVPFPRGTCAVLVFRYDFERQDLMIRIFLYTRRTHKRPVRQSVLYLPTYVRASTTRTLHLTIHVWRRQREGLMILTSGRETNGPTNPEWNAKHPRWIFFLGLAWCCLVGITHDCFKVAKLWSFEEYPK